MSYLGDGELLRHDDSSCLSGPLGVRQVSDGLRHDRLAVRRAGLGPQHHLSLQVPGLTLVPVRHLRYNDIQSLVVIENDNIITIGE